MFPMWDSYNKQVAEGQIKEGDKINKLEKEFLIKMAEGINNYNYDYTSIREMLLVLINGEITKEDIEKL